MATQNESLPLEYPMHGGERERERERDSVLSRLKVNKKSNGERAHTQLLSPIKVLCHKIKVNHTQVIGIVCSDPCDLFILK